MMLRGKTRRSPKENTRKESGTDPLNSAVPSSREQRRKDLRRGLVIEGVTIAWMIIESVIALSVGVLARSGATFAFGLDSLIELASAGVLVWRLRVEFGEAGHGRVEVSERRAGRIVGAALFVLAGYTVLQSAATVYFRIEAERTWVGIGLALTAVLGMPVLARIKQGVATAIGSAALRGDAACSIACAWMAAALLGGLVLNALFGWWWADPIAALGIVYYLVREGRESWSGCGCDDLEGGSGQILSCCNPEAGANGLDDAQPR